MKGEDQILKELILQIKVFDDSHAKIVDSDHSLIEFVITYCLCYIELTHSALFENHD